MSVKKVPLVTVATVFPGYGFPKKYQGKTDGKYPFYKVGDISKTVKDGKKLLDEADNYISDEVLGQIKGRTIPKDTVVFAKIGEALKLNRRAITTTNSLIDNNAVGISANENRLNFLYLYYFLLTFDLSKLSRATTVPSVRKSDLEEILIPVVELDEQQKIVDKIEELFSVIDACDQTILDTENKLSTYEYSFLKKCIYGDYLAESSNKLGSNSNSVELRSLPKGWQWKKLPELGELARGKSKHRPRNDKSLFGGKYPFIQTGEVRNSYKYIKSFSTTYNEKGLAQSKLWEKGTLCITIAANIADTAILDFDACFPDSVVGFIADTSICEVEYIEFFIRTEKERLAAYAPATAQKNINLKTLSNLLVPLPPLEEQRKIVEMAEEHSSVAHKLKTDFSHILRTKNLLKQSILKQAFEGKLV